MNKNLMTAVMTVFAAGAVSAQAGGMGPVQVNTSLAAQPRAFVTQPAVKPRLENLMGLVNARFLQKNFGTVSTLQHAGGVIAVTGCQPHHCAANNSLVAYDTKHDAFKVWLTVNGKTRIYTDKAFAGTFNSDVKAYINNM
ncbi:hypothetical protein GCM10017783_13860 [Deinococcus piscis]|uniref:Uncharacterized protein n=1 Tax=Deinococcus piscis TaxID=394230 RepID=A0ABQ3K444_9DEIO|nr:hypothetical protein [Deinococcus piscis]GHG02797.1 hypothetical protein GCM10017783_13860 [Deinococcus piscis]